MNRNNSSTHMHTTLHTTYYMPCNGNGVHTHGSTYTNGYLLSNMLLIMLTSTDQPTDTNTRLASRASLALL